MNAGDTRPKILVTNPIHAAVRARLETVGDVEMNPQVEPWTAAELAERARGVHAVMGFMTDRVDAATLAGAPGLRVVACALKGFDNYDVDACTRAGVWVSIVPDLLTEPTAELAIGLSIALARNVLPGDALLRSRQFRGWRTQLYGSGLAGATVAVVGLGQVGQAIVARLAGFGCVRIVGVDPCPAADGVERLSLDQALAQAHFVFVAAPLTTESHHLIDADALASARPGQFMVNVGRGSVVDEEAIADALDSGRLAGYAADVFAMEDRGLAQRPSVISPRLLDRINTVFTPHLGSAVSEVRIAIETRAADNIIAVLQGHPPPDAINQPVRTPGRRDACR